MRRADADGLRKSEPGEVCHKVFVLRRIDLVNGENDRPFGPAQPFRQRQIQRRGTILAVDNEKEQVGAFDGNLRGRMRLLRKIRIRICSYSTGVDDLERHDTKSAECDNPVARYSGLIMNDGNLAPGQAIEKSRFTDVRPTDDGDITHGDCRDAATV